MEVSGQPGTLETWEQENPEPQEISVCAWSGLKSQTTKSQREQAGKPGNW